MYYAAAAATILVVITLIYLNKFELGHHSHTIRLTTSDKINQMVAVISVLTHYGVSINQIMVNNHLDGLVVIEININASRKHQLHELIHKLNELEGISRVSIDRE